MNVDYQRIDEYWRRHHIRFVRRVSERKLICQECGGAGGHTEYVDYWLGGPWECCVWCEGTGYVTPWIRGQWLKFKREAAA